METKMAKLFAHERQKRKDSERWVLSWSVYLYDQPSGKAWSLKKLGLHTTHAVFPQVSVSVWFFDSKMIFCRYSWCEGFISNTSATSLILYILSQLITKQVMMVESESKISFKTIIYQSFKGLRYFCLFILGQCFFSFYFSRILSLFSVFLLLLSFSVQVMTLCDISDYL